MVDGIIYKKTNHFRERIQKTEEKCNFQIPSDVMIKLEERFEKFSGIYPQFCQPGRLSFVSYSVLIHRPKILLRDSFRKFVIVKGAVEPPKLNLPTSYFLD